MTPNEMVLEFMQTFGQEVRSSPRANIPEELLRVDLIKEEGREYEDAVYAGDIVEIGDALGDLIYVVHGAALAHGIHNLDEIVAEIHRSNMSKLGFDGKPIFRDDGKVLKGPNYFKPDIAKILEYRGLRE